MKAPAPTKEGRASGKMSTIRQIRRPGRSVRTVSQASNVPSSAADIDTSTASWIVRHSGPGISLNVSENDASRRKVRQTTNTAGTANSAPSATLSSDSGLGRIVAPIAIAGVCQLSRPASAISSRVRSRPPSSSSKSITPTEAKSAGGKTT